MIIIWLCSSLDFSFWFINVAQSSIHFPISFKHHPKISQCCFFTFPQLCTTVRGLICCAWHWASKRQFIVSSFFFWSFNALPSPSIFGGGDCGEYWCVRLLLLPQYSQYCVVNVACYVPGLIWHSITSTFSFLMTNKYFHLIRTSKPLFRNYWRTCTFFHQLNCSWVWTNKLTRWKTKTQTDRATNKPTLMYKHTKTYTPIHRYTQPPIHTHIQIKRVLER